MSSVLVPPQLAGNRPLAAMARTDAERLRPYLEEVPLPAGEVLFEAGGLIDHAWFPDAGVISLVSDQGVGRRVEVGLIGAEGVLGVTALLGEPSAKFRAMVQVAGRARRAPVAALRPMLHGSYAMRDLFMRIATAALHRSAAAAACHALHPLSQRAAGWLLALHDRAGPGLAVTQEAMADMLGARRPTVNVVMRRFVAEGMVRTARGRIAIADVAALEAAACSCQRGVSLPWASPAR